MKNIKLVLTLVFIFLFINSCSANNITDEKENRDNDLEAIDCEYQNEIIWQEIIYFKVLNTVDLNNNKFEIEIIKNFNDEIPLDTEIDKAIKKDKKIEIIVSDTYSKYIKEDDYFIFQLQSLKIKDNEIIIDCTLNEEALLPVVNNKIKFNIITTNIEKINNDSDYKMFLIVNRRRTFYQRILTEEVVEFDLNVGEIRSYFNDDDDVGIFSSYVKLAFDISNGKDKIKQ